MNRQQKVAVVVGVVVVVLLALFPTWRLGDGASHLPGWSYQHGPAWIGSPPSSPPPVYVSDVRGDLRRLSEDDSGSYERIQGRTSVLQQVTINWAQLGAHIAATLALTVAAVVVLRERKA